MSTSNSCFPNHPRLSGFLKQVLGQPDVHGMKYLVAPNLHIIERVFWGIIVLISMGVTIWLGQGLYTKYKASPVIISFQPTQTPVAEIAFPAITLCNVNILKNHVIRNIYANLVMELIKSNYSSDSEGVRSTTMLAQHLTHICLSAKSFRRHLTEGILSMSIKDDAFYDALVRADEVDNLNRYLFDNPDLERSIAENRDFIRVEEEAQAFFKNSSHKCEDMILRCLWASQPMDCKKLFRHIHTRHGACCVFNMMPKYFLRKMPINATEAAMELDQVSPEEREGWSHFAKADLMPEVPTQGRTVPKYQTTGGAVYGLSILVNPELDLYSTCNTDDAMGMKLLAHSPVSFPTVIEHGVAIPPRSEVFVDVVPHVTVADSNIMKTIPPNMRGCLLTQDKSAMLGTYKVYTQTNCLSECIAKQLYKNCGCVRFFMPREPSQRLCGAKDMICWDKLRRNITKSTRGSKKFCPKCRPSCTQVNYRVQTSHLPLRLNENTTIHYNLSSGEAKTASNYSILHIYYGADSFYATERKRLYGLSELLGNAGGLLGLTLGMSIVSLVEFFYYFTLRAWFQFRSFRKDDKRSGNTTTAIARPPAFNHLQAEHNMINFFTT